MDAVPKHRSHPEIVKRLRRAEGHLRSVIAMIEAERPCLELAQQMHAVEKAIGQAKKALIEWCSTCSARSRSSESLGW